MTEKKTFLFCELTGWKKDGFEIGKILAFQGPDLESVTDKLLPHQLEDLARTILDVVSTEKFKDVWFEVVCMGGENGITLNRKGEE